MSCRDNSSIPNRRSDGPRDGRCLSGRQRITVEERKGCGGCEKGWRPGGGDDARRLQGKGRRSQLPIKGGWEERKVSGGSVGVGVVACGRACVGVGVWKEIVWYSAMP